MKSIRESLRPSFDDSISAVAKNLHRFPWANPEAYALWLAQHYYLIRHTTTFLALLAGKHGAENPEKLRDTLRHLREETGHEVLPLKDLKALGFELSGLPELLETSLLYQSQYYWIDRCGPVAHAGYALMLEGLAAKEGKAIVEIIEKHHGKSAASYLRVHVQDDIDHFEQGINRLSAAPEPDLALAIENLNQCRQLYSMMLKEIIVSHGKTELFKKAA